MQEYLLILPICLNIHFFLLPISFVQNFSHTKCNLDTRMSEFPVIKNTSLIKLSLLLYNQLRNRQANLFGGFNNT